MQKDTLQQGHHDWPQKVGYGKSIVRKVYKGFLQDIIIVITYSWIMRKMDMNLWWYRKMCG